MFVGISVHKLFARALQRFGTCLLINNTLCGKLVSSLELPIIFDDNFSFNFILFLNLIALNSNYCIESFYTVKN